MGWQKLPSKLMVKRNWSPSTVLQMLVWALDMASPFKQLVAATACAGCALLLASVALRSNGKPALPPLTDLPESTTLPEMHGGTEKTATLDPELHGGTEKTLQWLADFADGVCGGVVACALFHLPQTDSRPASATSPWIQSCVSAIQSEGAETFWIAEKHDWAEEEDDNDLPTASPALHAAAWLGNEGAVRLLLEQGEDGPATTDDGAAPFFYM